MFDINGDGDVEADEFAQVFKKKHILFRSIFITQLSFQSLEISAIEYVPPSPSPLDADDVSKDCLDIIQLKQLNYLPSVLNLIGRLWRGRGGGCP